MVDTATYKRLHGDAKETAAQQSAQKKNQQTEDSGPPKGNAIYLFPPTVIGYNMRVKKWGGPPDTNSLSGVHMLTGVLLSGSLCRSDIRSEMERPSLRQLGDQP